MIISSTYGNDITGIGVIIIFISMIASAIGCTVLSIFIAEKLDIQWLYYAGIPLSVIVAYLVVFLLIKLQI